MESPDFKNLVSNLKLSKTNIAFVLLGLFLLLFVVISTTIVLSPFLLIGFIFYYFFQLINKIHCRNTNFKFDTKK
jgi:hypothetical protein